MAAYYRELTCNFPRKIFFPTLFSIAENRILAEIVGIIIDSRGVDEPDNVEILAATRRT